MTAEPDDSRPLVRRAAQAPRRLGTACRLGTATALLGAGLACGELDDTGGDPPPTTRCAELVGVPASPLARSSSREGAAPHAAPSPERPWSTSLSLAHPDDPDTRLALHALVDRLRDEVRPGAHGPVEELAIETSDLKLRFERRRVDRTRVGVDVWVGIDPRHPAREAHLAFWSDGLYGTIHDERGAWELWVGSTGEVVRPLPEGEILDDVLPSPNLSGTIGDATGSVDAPTWIDTVDLTPTTIQLLALVTSDARAELATAFGLDDPYATDELDRLVSSLLAQRVARTNTALENSGVTARVELLRLRTENPDDGASVKTIYCGIRRGAPHPSSWDPCEGVPDPLLPTDARFEDVYQKMDDAGADLVALVTSTPEVSTFPGISDGINADPDGDVNFWMIARWDFEEVFPHELGHLLGAWHTTATVHAQDELLPHPHDQFCSTFAFSVEYGRVDLRDLMSYEADCPRHDAVPAVTCRAINFYSNATRAIELPFGSGEMVTLGTDWTGASVVDAQGDLVCDDSRSSAAPVMRALAPTVGAYRDSQVGASIEARAAVLADLAAADDGPLDPGPHQVSWSPSPSFTSPTRFVLDTGSRRGLSDLGRIELDGTARSHGILVTNHVSTVWIRLWTRISTGVWAWQDASYAVDTGLVDCASRQDDARPGAPNAFSSAHCAAADGEPVCWLRGTEGGSELVCDLQQGVVPDATLHDSFEYAAMDGAPGSHFPRATLATFYGGTTSDVTAWGTNLGGERFCCQLLEASFVDLRKVSLLGSPDRDLLSTAGDGFDLQRLPVDGALQVVVDGGGGNDAITGSDECDGSRFQEDLWGRDGDDDLDGGGGRDVLRGGVGVDHLRGGGGGDVLHGGGGDDVLEGGPGDDFLQGDLGVDELYGDEGPDEPSPALPGDDVLCDFDVGDATILHGGGGDDQLLLALVGPPAAGTVIDGGDGSDDHCVLWSGRTECEGDADYVASAPHLCPPWDTEGLPEVLGTRP